MDKLWVDVPKRKWSHAAGRPGTSGGRKQLHRSGGAAVYLPFEPGCRNSWHIHHAETGGGQILICTAGEGWYQEWGSDPVELLPGEVIVIPQGVKHWHGAKKDSWFAHISLEVPGEKGATEWLEPVDEAAYNAL